MIKKIKILLCTMPDGSLEDTMSPPRPEENGFMNPCIGILRIDSWLVKNNYETELYDINNLRPTDEELIKEFKEINPDVVGISAPLSHCYPSVVRVTKILRKLFPDIWIVIGGAITASSHLLLRRLPIDICVVGDGEISFVKLLDYIKSNPDRKVLDFNKLSKIQGLTYLENNKLQVTGFGEQLTPSELEYPDYEKQRKALRGKEEWIWHLFKPLKTDSGFSNLSKKLLPATKALWEKNKDKNLAYVPTSLGCVAKCTFCQRYTKGYRIYQTTGLEAYLRELKERYNIGAVEIWDENFGSNKKQGYEVARIMKKLDLLWKAPAIRVRSVTYEDLVFYANHNLMSLKFGIEAGSQTILDVMEKKNSLQDNYTTIVNCNKAGVQTPNPGGIILGMPGENLKTVEALAENMATLRYAAGVHSGIYGAFWAWPVPGTPLYEYCQQIGVIGKTMDEEEEYLYRSSETKVDFLNHVKTSDRSTKELYFWSNVFAYAQKIGFRNEIFKSNLTIKQKIKELYEKCIKIEIDGIAKHTKKIFGDGDVLKLRTSPVSRLTSQGKNVPLYKKLKSFAGLLYKNSLLISSLFLPRSVTYFFVRIYSNVLFINFQHKFKNKNGKQKYNIFAQNEADLTNQYRISEIKLNELAEPDRGYSAKRSLRQFVLANREKMTPAMTDEDKGMALLAKGQ